MKLNPEKCEMMHLDWTNTIRIHTINGKILARNSVHIQTADIDSVEKA